MNYTELVQLAGAQIGFNPSAPYGWSEIEIEFAANEALKKISTYFGDWVAETTLSLTDATDTYALPATAIKVSRWSYAEDSHKYYIIDRNKLPTDGREGKPQYAAIEKSAPSNPTRKGMIFYPYPEDDYEVIVTYQYVPRVDRTEPTEEIPVSIELEYPLVMFMCHFLASKSTVEKNSYDQENYYQQAMRSINTTASLQVNDEVFWRKGYV